MVESVSDKVFDGIKQQYCAQLCASAMQALVQHIHLTTRMAQSVNPNKGMSDALPQVHAQAIHSESHLARPQYQDVSSTAARNAC